MIKFSNRFGKLAAASALLFVIVSAIPGKSYAHHLGDKDSCTYTGTAATPVTDHFEYPVGNPFVRPTKSFEPNGFQISQAYKVANHLGVDLLEDINDDGIGDPGASVWAVADGRVVYIQERTSSRSFGYMVRVEHVYGGKKYYSQYSHMLTGSIDVTCGQEVTAGSTELGKVGSTGYSTGNHLHLEIKKINENGCGYIISSCHSKIYNKYEYYYEPISFIWDRIDGPITQEGIFNTFAPEPTVVDDAAVIRGSETILGLVRKTAVKFSIDQSGQLGAVQIAGGMWSGTPEFLISIHEDNGGIPGDIVASMRLKNIPDTFFGGIGSEVSEFLTNIPLTTCASGSTILKANSNYFISVAAGAPDSYGVWYDNSLGITGEIASWSDSRGGEWILISISEEIPVFKISFLGDSPEC